MSFQAILHRSMCSQQMNSSGNGALGSGNGNSDTTIIISSSTTSPGSSATNPSTLVVTTSFTTPASNSTPSIVPPTSPASSPSVVSSPSSSPKASSTPLVQAPPSTAASPQKTTRKTSPSLTTVQGLAAIPTKTSQAQQSTQAPQNTNTQQPSGNSDVTQMLQLHNNLRATHGAGALTWSSTLAAKAQQWANGCVFQHSGGSLGPFGGMFMVLVNKCQSLISLLRKSCLRNWK